MLRLIVALQHVETSREAIRGSGITKKPMQQYIYISPTFCWQSERIGTIVIIVTGYK
jgi:adenosylmethionine-8-amino-7-oxononanoate aminotransferase